MRAADGSGGGNVGIERAQSVKQFRFLSTPTTPFRCLGAARFIVYLIPPLFIPVPFPMRPAPSLKQIFQRCKRRSTGDAGDRDRGGGGEILDETALLPFGFLHRVLTVNRFSCSVTVFNSLGGCYR